MTKKRKKHVGIVRLEERVLFEAAAAVEAANLAAEEAENENEQKAEETAEDIAEKLEEVAVAAGPDSVMLGNESVIRAEEQAEGVESEEAEGENDENVISVEGPNDFTADENDVTVTGDITDSDELDFNDPSSIVIENSNEVISVEGNVAGNEAETEEVSANEIADEIKANSEQAAKEAEEESVAAGEEKAEGKEDRKELVIINSSTADKDVLISEVGEGRDILILDTNSSDPMADIKEYMESKDYKYDAVHIVTHGDDSGLIIGSRYVQDGAEFGVMREHLSDDADVMVYGCSTAATEKGQAFLQDIADATGADISASVDMTGSSDRGGNWDLEYSIGEINVDSLTVSNNWNYKFDTIHIGSTASPGFFANLSAATRTTLIDGDFVILHGNVTETVDITVSGDTQFISVGGENYTYTFTGDFTVGADATLTVGGTYTDGGVTYDGGVTFVGTVTNQGTITLDNSTFKGNVTGGTVTLNDGAALNITGESTVTTLTVDGGANASIGGTGTLTLANTITLSESQTLSILDRVSLHNSSGTGHDAYVIRLEDSGYPFNTSAGNLILNTTGSITTAGNVAIKAYSDTEGQGSITVYGNVKLGAADAGIEFSGRGDFLISGGNSAITNVDSAQYNNMTGVQISGNGELVINGGKISGFDTGLQVGAGSVAYIKSGFVTGNTTLDVLNYGSIYKSMTSVGSLENQNSGQSYTSVTVGNDGDYQDITSALKYVSSKSNVTGDNYDLMIKDGTDADDLTITESVHVTTNLNSVQGLDISTDSDGYLLINGDRVQVSDSDIDVFNGLLNLTESKELAQISQYIYKDGKFFVLSTAGTAVNGAGELVLDNNSEFKFTTLVEITNLTGLNTGAGSGTAKINIGGTVYSYAYYTIDDEGTIALFAGQNTGGGSAINNNTLFAANGTKYLYIDADGGSLHELNDSQPVINGTEISINGTVLTDAVYNVADGKWYQPDGTTEIANGSTVTAGSATYYVFNQRLYKETAADKASAFSTTCLTVLDPTTEIATSTQYHLNGTGEQFREKLADIKVVEGNRYAEFTVRDNAGTWYINANLGTDNPEIDDANVISAGGKDYTIYGQKLYVTTSNNVLTDNMILQGADGTFYLALETDAGKAEIEIHKELLHNTEKPVSGKVNVTFDLNGDGTFGANEYLSKDGNNVQMDQYGRFEHNGKLIQNGEEFYSSSDSSKSYVYQAGKFFEKNGYVGDDAPDNAAYNTALENLNTLTHTETYYNHHSGGVNSLHGGKAETINFNDRLADRSNTEIQFKQGNSTVYIDADGKYHLGGVEGDFLRNGNIVTDTAGTQYYVCVTGNEYSLYKVTDEKDVALSTDNLTVKDSYGKLVDVATNEDIHTNRTLGKEYSSYEKGQNLGTSLEALDAAQGKTYVYTYQEVDGAKEIFTQSGNTWISVGNASSVIVDSDASKDLLLDNITLQAGGTLEVNARNLYFRTDVNTDLNAWNAQDAKVFAEAIRVDANGTLSMKEGSKVTMETFRTEKSVYGIRSFGTVNFTGGNIEIRSPHILDGNEVVAVENNGPEATLSFADHKSLFKLDTTDTGMWYAIKNSGVISLDAELVINEFDRDDTSTATLYGIWNTGNLDVTAGMTVNAAKGEVYGIQNVKEIQLNVGDKVVDENGYVFTWQGQGVWKADNGGTLPTADSTILRMLNGTEGTVSSSGVLTVQDENSDHVALSTITVNMTDSEYIYVNAKNVQNHNAYGIDNRAGAILDIESGNLRLDVRSGFNRAFVALVNAGTVTMNDGSIVAAGYTWNDGMMEWLEDSENSYATAIRVDSGSVTLDASDAGNKISVTAQNKHGFAVVNKGNFTFTGKRDEAAAIKVTDDAVLSGNVESSEGSFTLDKVRVEGYWSNAADGAKLGYFYNNGISRMLLNDIYVNRQMRFENSGTSLYITGDFVGAEGTDVLIFNGDRGAVYMGTASDSSSFEDSIAFSNVLDYTFVNWLGGFDISNFNNLSSLEHPVTIINGYAGITTSWAAKGLIGHPGADNETASFTINGGDTPQDLYVSTPYAYAGSTNDERLQTTGNSSVKNELRARFGNLKVNPNLYIETYQQIETRDMGILNYSNMELRNLNVINKKDNAAALTTIGGDVDIVGGALLGTKRGLDILYSVSYIDSSVGIGPSKHTNPHMGFFFNTANVSVDGLEKIVGGERAISNYGGVLTQQGEIILANNDAAAQIYAVTNGSYGIYNESIQDISVALTEQTDSTTVLINLAFNSNLISFDRTDVPKSITTNGTVGSHMYMFNVKGDAPAADNEFDFPDSYGNVTGNNPKTYHYSSGYILGDISMGTVKFSQATAVDNSTAIYNAGNVTIDLVKDGFTGFSKAITNIVSVGGEHTDNSGGQNSYKPVLDITIDFAMSANNTYLDNKSILILRGYKDGSTYKGSLTGSGESGVVIDQYAGWHLENISVSNEDGNAFTVQNGILSINNADDFGGTISSGKGYAINNSGKIWLNNADLKGSTAALFNDDGGTAMIWGGTFTGGTHSAIQNEGSLTVNQANYTVDFSNNANNQIK